MYGWDPTDDAIARESVTNEIGSHQFTGAWIKEQIACAVELVAVAFINDKVDKAGGILTEDHLCNGTIRNLRSDGRQKAGDRLQVCLGDGLNRRHRFVQKLHWKKVRDGTNVLRTPSKVATADAEHHEEGKQVHTGNLM